MVTTARGQRCGGEGEQWRAARATEAVAGWWVLYDAWSSGKGGCGAAGLNRGCRTERVVRHRPDDRRVADHTANLRSLIEDVEPGETKEPA